MSKAQPWAAHLAVAVFRAICWLLYPLSIGALRRIGSVAGRIAFLLNGRAVRTTRINLAIAYPDQSDAWRERLARDSIRHTAMVVLEAVAMWTWPLARLGSLVKHVQGEHLLRDRPRARGLIVMPLHLGNWEFIGYYLNTVAPLAPLYEKPKSAIVDAALRSARARHGNRSAPDTVSGLRQLLKVLRDGGMVAVLPDQVPIVGSGVAAPFFDRKAFTMTLVAKLLQRVDADIVFGNAIRVTGGFAIRIETIDDAIRDGDASISVAAMNAAIEALVRRHPEQYQWEYKRFRFPRQPNIYR